MFEAGAYTIIKPLTLQRAVPTERELQLVQNDGVVAVFQKLAREVAGFHIYDRFYLRGWTQAISRDVRRELAPRMVRMITLAWYAACREAGETA
jgi:hypothetical protein